MDDAVCHDHQDHVIPCLFLHVLANIHSLPQQRSEESRSTKGQIWQCSTVTLDDACKLIQIRVFS